jgi:lipopolysaccharide export system protein LptC
MRSRLYDRMAAGISVLLLMVLGLFTYYLAQVNERQQAQAARARPPSDSPDYFVERLALLSMNERGEPSFRLEAKQLEHFAPTDSTVFRAPVMVSLDPAQPRVTVSAARGRLIEGGDEVQLSGNVLVSRAGSTDTPPLRISTEFAVVFPGEDVIRTDRPVSVAQEGSVLEGIGMELNNRTRQLRVDSKVRVVWQAPPPGAAAGAARPPPKALR